MRDVESSPRFSPDFRHALTLAQEEAANLNHWLIGTEHLMLALIRQGGVLGDLLGGYGVSLEKAREAVRAIGPSVQLRRPEDLPQLPSTVVQSIRGGVQSFGDPGLTPRAAAAVDHAVREAQQMRIDVEPAHLMLGLLTVTDGVSAGMLCSFGIALNQLADQVRELLEPSR